ncbi:MULTISPECIES: hypothetical protein [unclassified Pseudomonas]|uniref:hypothetical protein n=1 Tax=unclassified Pseudomonas TaxID=196821 RepID=UPI0015A1CFAC|nr:MULTISPECIES: hypothetical protein [unclassified Pseudomonas]NWA35307.1 hypothetical protein [Pseudomonas sp. C6002]NWB64164.1 hypothetical protein [Pseudomonas sp. F1002]
MTLFIEKLETPAGDALINVPASVQTLKGLGFSDVAAQALIEKAAASAALASTIAARRSAYVSEADPMYLEWQFDGTPEKEKEWRAKVAEIKARFPLPEDK